jgi:Thioredoxin
VTAPVGTAAGVSAPPAPALSRERFEAGLTFADFLAAARANVDLWRAIYARAHVSDDAIARVVASARPWHLLVLAEDWCGDAVNTVPVMARLAEHAPNLDLRILPRDANLDLMDAHLTAGARSIPIAILLDADYQERGAWGPRPSALQTWVVTVGRTLDKHERYREVRRWYAHDHGVSTIEEIVALMKGD